MLISLPPPPSGGLGQHFSRLNQAIVNALAPVVSQKEAARQIILSSPNGTNYAVTVDNAGGLVVSAISGKQPF